MAQKRIDKTKEEAYQILINTKDKKSFAQAFGYKDARSALSICKRFDLNIEDLGMNVGGYYGKWLKEKDIFGMLTVIKANCDKINGETASLCLCECGQETLVKMIFLNVVIQQVVDVKKDMIKIIKFQMDRNLEI